MKEKTNGYNWTYYSTYPLNSARQVQENKINIHKLYDIINSGELSVFGDNTFTTTQATRAEDIISNYDLAQDLLIQNNTSNVSQNTDNIAVNTTNIDTLANIIIDNEPKKFVTSKTTDQSLINNTENIIVDWELPTDNDFTNITFDNVTGELTVIGGNIEDANIVFVANLTSDVVIFGKEIEVGIYKDGVIVGTPIRVTINQSGQAIILTNYTFEPAVYTVEIFPDGAFGAVILSNVFLNISTSSSSGGGGGKSSNIIDDTSTNPTLGINPKLLEKEKWVEKIYDKEGEFQFIYDRLNKDAYIYLYWDKFEFLPFYLPAGLRVEGDNIPVWKINDKYSNIELYDDRIGFQLPTGQDQTVYKITIYVKE